MDLVHTLFVPPGGGPHPTILALHGWGANALDLLGLAPYIGSGRYLVLCPQGTVQMSLGPGAVGYGWFPSTGGGPPDLPAIDAAHEHLLVFLDAACQRYPIDPRKLVLLGFSQGGVMTYRFGLSAPERFAAIVALSTWLPTAFLDQRPPVEASTHPPLFIQHGTRDELVSVERARQSVQALRPLGVPVTYREYDMGHEINAPSLTDLSAWLQERVLSPLIV
jgi:phospholipase/carboxylesterase